MDAELRHTTYATYPHWKNPDDARTALAMLLENDEAMLYLLNGWNAALIKPLVRKQLEEPS